MSHSRKGALRTMSYIKLPAFEQSGYVGLDPYDQPQDPAEWVDIEYVDWKSSGDTRFAPLASAYGDMECNGFWNHTPPKTDKDGVWVQANVDKAPRLTARALEPGANVGRCRVIELQPNTYAESIYNLHRDDNHDSVMVLREDKDDPSTETRIPLPAGAQVIIDTQRLWHAVWHPGDEPRYCLITSWESGPELDAYIEKLNPQSKVDSAPIDAEFAAKAYEEVAARIAARAAARAAQNGGMDSPIEEVKSEA